MTLRHLRLVTFVVSIGIIGAAAWKLDLRTTAAALRSMSWRWAAIAGTINLAGVLVDAGRWMLILSAATRATLRNAWRAFLAGIVANVVVPLKLGDAARAHVMARLERVSLTTVLTTVLLDRVTDAATLPLFLVAASLLVPLPESVLRLRKWSFVIVAVIAAGIVVARNILAPPEDGPAGGRVSTITRIRKGLAVMRHHHRLLPVFGMAFLAWCARVAIVWCMFQAFDLRLPLAAAITVVVIINVGIAAVAMPGNAGVFELSAATALSLWDVRPEIGVSFGLAMHAVEVVPPLLLGLATVRTYLRGEIPRMV